MKARIPLPKEQLSYAKNLSKNYAVKEFERQKNDLIRRCFKLFDVVLHEEFGFGLSRLSRLHNCINEKVDEMKDDEIFWEHIDKELIDQVGMPYPRDYTR